MNIRTAAKSAAIGAAAALVVLGVTLPHLTAGPGTINVHNTATEAAAPDDTTTTLADDTTTTTAPATTTTTVAPTTTTTRVAPTTTTTTTLPGPMDCGAGGTITPTISVGSNGPSHYILVLLSGTNTKAVMIPSFTVSADYPDGTTKTFTSVKVYKDTFASPIEWMVIPSLGDVEMTNPLITFFPPCA